ncbi:MAG TPA: CBS domain-containing protein [Vicinamibacterales bacterium]|jgi:acetoin utilization protein AcuB
MRVQDVMTRGVKTVPVTATADEAWTQMRMKRIHHLVVLDARAMVGVISDRDMGGRGGAAVRNRRLVRELMTKGVITIAPDAPVRKAANLLRGRSIGCLVVTDHGYVVGIITTADLLDLIGRGAERSVATSRRWTLNHRVPHRKRHQATGTW